MKITHMRTGHVKNPMGFLMEQPVFSYKVTGARGTKQALACIRVAKNESMEQPMYNSGLREDIDSIAFPVPIKLEPYTRYYWTVEVTTDVGETIQSEPAWFETGKQNEPWKGMWICSKLNEEMHPIFYKDVAIEKPVENARLYICGLGLYEAYINGNKVGEECLTPYCNDYTQWLQYQTYDVTDMLFENARLEVLLGNGWYKGRFGLDDDGSTEKLYGDTFLLCAELRIQYQDGSIQVIGTNESWKARKSKILDSSFYNGEVYDETVADDTVYPVTVWDKPMPTLTERLSLPIRVMETLRPIQAIHSPKDELILDLGQNHSGWFSLRVHEAKGVQLKLYFGEELQDGCFYNGNLRTGKQEYTYISDGVERTIRPHFTTYGYRYVKLEGFANFVLEDYTGLVLYSQLEQTASIETGNPLVDRLALNSLWGQKSNFLDIPMDCPQRDERMGWTGDAQVFTPAACFNMDSYAFYKKFLYDMHQEQLHRNGAVPFVVPACGQDSSCGIWGDAATIMPTVLYQFYGDKGILASQYESMKAWVEYIRAVNGTDWRWLRIFHFGDWLALDSRNEAMPTGGTDVGYVATAYYYQSVCLLAQAARLLGKNDDADIYESHAQELLEEIHSEYFSAKGRLCIDTQTGLLIALKFGLTPNPARTRRDLRQAFKRNGDKLETGFVGTSMLCNVLTENGMNELAYSLLLNEGYPGWLYSVKKGATTIWERWDSLDENGHFSASGLNSLNHYSYGAIVEWMYRHAAGISPLLSAPGFREVALEPKPDSRIGKVDACFDSPIGVYRSRWEVTESYGLKLDITVPFGGTAYLTLPYAPDDLYKGNDNPIFETIYQTESGLRCALKAGSYQVEYATTIPMRKVYGLETTIAELYGNEAAKTVILQAIPMLAMLPESMHGKTLKELLAILPTPLDADKQNNLIQQLADIS